MIYHRPGALGHLQCVNMCVSECVCGAFTVMRNGIDLVLQHIMSESD